MSNILLFRGKYHNDRISQAILDREAESLFLDADATFQELIANAIKQEHKLLEEQVTQKDWRDE